MWVLKLIILSSFLVELPVIVSNLQDTLSVLLNQNFTLSCNATGIPQPNITWYKDGTVVLSDPPHLRLLGYTLAIYDTVFGDEGVYRCVVSNSGGTAEDNIIVNVICKSVCV